MVKYLLSISSIIIFFSCNSNNDKITYERFYGPKFIEYAWDGNRRYEIYNTNDSVVEMERIYVNGVLDSTTEYWGTGDLWFQTQYKNGIRHGNHFCYYEDGKTLQYAQVYDNDSLISSEYFPLRLDIPSYSDSVVYFGCENVSKPINIEIYGDSTIDLNTIDPRLSIKFKFNWLYENKWPNKLGVTSIDIVKDNSVINNMDFSYLELEASMNKYSKSERFMQIVRDDMYLVDINMDSYLDFTINWNSRGNPSYWIYNPDKEIFEFNKELNYMRPYHVDCYNKIIYSFQGGTAWYFTYNQYKLDNEIELIGSVYKERNEDYNLEVYKDAKGVVISSDTTYNN